ncbi:hypothetical protein ACFQZ4_16125 [Catellatospora coxensis]
MHLTSRYRRVIGGTALGALLTLTGGAPTVAAPEGRDSPVLRPAVAWGDNGAGGSGTGPGSSATPRSPCPGCSRWRRSTRAPRTGSRC